MDKPDINKVPRFLLFDMFRMSGEINYLKFLDKLEDKWQEIEKQVNEFLEMED